jgi:hypothetical protein
MTQHSYNATSMREGNNCIHSHNTLHPDLPVGTSIPEMIGIHAGSDNAIMGNWITNYSIGMFTGSINSIAHNVVSDNTIGLQFGAGSGDSIIWNNTISSHNCTPSINSGHTLVFGPAGSHQWFKVDTGNRWGDYEIKYPNAPHNGRVWDTAYVIAAGVRDRYPLLPINPPVPPTIEINPRLAVIITRLFVGTSYKPIYFLEITWQDQPWVESYQIYRHTQTFSGIVGMTPFKEIRLDYYRELSIDPLFRNAEPLYIPSWGMWYFYDTDVAPGRGYYYMVVARNAKGDSVVSICVGLSSDEILLSYNDRTHYDWYWPSALVGVAALATIGGLIVRGVRKKFEKKNWARAARNYYRPRNTRPTVAVPTVTERGIEWSIDQGHYLAPKNQSAWTSSDEIAPISTAERAAPVISEPAAPVVPRRAAPVVTETGWETTPVIAKKCSICGATQVDASVVFCRSCGYMIK